MNVLDRFESALKVAERFAIYAAAAVMFAIMLIVVADVFGRYALNSPLGWSYDLISMYLTVAVFFFALSPSFAGRHHVAVDIFCRRAPQAVQRLLRLFWQMVALSIFVAIAGLLLEQALTAWQNAEVIAGEIPWPTWVPPASGTLGAGVLATRLVLSILRLVAGAEEEEAEETSALSAGNRAE